MSDVTGVAYEATDVTDVAYEVTDVSNGRFVTGRLVT